MGMEAFAELASVLAPGYSVAAIENVQFANPFKFYRHQPRTLLLNASLRPSANGELIARTALQSLAPKAQPGPQLKVHFSAEVRLSCIKTGLEPVPVEGSQKRSGLSAPTLDTLSVGAEQIYKVYFHGPAYQVLERAGVDGERAIGLLARDLPSDTRGGVGQWLMAPRLMEFCFQTAGLWQIATQGVMALPMALASAQVFHQLEEAGSHRLYAVAETKNGGASFDAHVIDDAGVLYVTLSAYRTVQLPGSVRL